MQGAKESLDRMADGARMASLDLPGLLDAKVTLERQGVLEHQVKVPFLLFPLSLPSVLSAASNMDAHTALP
jgi:hypothetical protein